MKKLILCGLFGALALLLAQHPQPVKAMDSGMMGNGDYGSYDMGPGMMHDGGSRTYGMGAGMMDQGYENEPHYYHNQKSLDKKDAARILNDYLNSNHNPNLKLGEVKDLLSRPTC